MKASLLTPYEYLADAVLKIQNATNHISLATMIISEDITTKPLLDALCEASRRGVLVVVTADLFTYAEIGGHFKFHTKSSKLVKSLSDMQKRLQESGVSFRWLGRINSSLINGRTHSKWLVVDDHVYTFGGVNLYKNGIDSIDFMLHLKDTSLSSRLIAEQSRLIKADKANRAYRSRKIALGKHKVLIDGGFVGDSVIYRHACRLTESATSIVYVSQYCPTGKLGRLLKKKNATLYYNPSNQAKSLNALAIRLGSFLSGLKTSYTRSPYIHCKFMIFTLPDGSKQAITGSNNFSSAGVWLGTREIALETGDTNIVKQLEHFLKKYIA